MHKDAYNFYLGFICSIFVLSIAFIDLMLVCLCRNSVCCFDVMNSIGYTYRNVFQYTPISVVHPDNSLYHYHYYVSEFMYV